MDAEKVQLPLAQYLPELVRLKEAGTDFVLVAGQAVNFWANHFKGEDPELLDFMPFVSKDVDLFGTIDDLYMIPNVLDGELKRFRELWTPVMGVFTSNTEPHLMFELLRTVYGPVSTDKINHRALTIGGIKVIDPLSLLISKSHNAGGIDQDKRQDVRHVKMMVICARRHFERGANAVGEYMTPRQFINEAKYLLGFADDSVFQKGLTMAEATLIDCFPIEKIQSIGTEHEAIARFTENTLLPSIHSLSS